MSFRIKTTPPFEKQVKRLSKKYPSLKSDLVILQKQLEQNPLLGTALGHNCYKLRLSIAAKKKGKRGGGRIITHVLVDATTVYLLSIYDKSETENISDKELEALLKAIQDLPEL